MKKLTTLFLIFYGSIAAPAQNVGIGNSNPAYPLDASGNIRVRSLGTAPGIWLNKLDNSDLSHFAGNLDDTTYGISSAGQGFRFFFDSKNGYMGLDQVAPRYPLSFARSFGNKISLYSPTAQPGSHYGIGVQSGQLQFYVPTLFGNFAFGSGSSTGFSESVRITAAGQVGIGTVPMSSAALDVGGTARAFYPPRVTTAQRNNIFQPQAGAMVFDTDKSLLYYFNGQAWMALGPADMGSIGVQTVTASDGQTYDRFGAEVAISGDYAIVAAPEKTAGAFSKVGGAYIFHKVNGIWVQEAILAPPTPSANLQYGIKVGISGDHAIVATNAAQVFIYQRSGTAWNVVTSLAVGSINVAIDANYALVANGTDVKLYKRAGTNPTTWTLQTTLNPGSSGQLGTGLDISGDNFIVGDPGATANTVVSAGKSYVYALNNNTWTLQGTLFNPGSPNNTVGPQFYERSGTSVAIQGDTAVVGAPYRNVQGNPIGEGAVYLFKRTGTTWSYIQMQRGQISSDEELGITVAKSGPYIFAAATHFYAAPPQPRIVYMYKFNSAGIFTLQKIYKDNTEEGIGYQVDASGNNYVIGNFASELFKGKVTFGEIVSQ